MVRISSRSPALPCHSSRCGTRQIRCVPSRRPILRSNVPTGTRPALRAASTMRQSEKPTDRLRSNIECAVRTTSSSCSVSGAHEGIDALVYSPDGRVQ